MRFSAIAMIGLTGAALMAALSGCAPRVKSPEEPGVCYFIGHPTPKEVKFNVLARNVPDLEHCAVLLYNLRMNLLKTGTAGDETDGAYANSFLYAYNTEVRYALHYEGPAFPFLVKAPDNRLVSPGSVVEDDTPPSGPQTVDVPKDLPGAPSGGKK